MLLNVVIFWFLKLLFVGCLSKLLGFLNLEVCCWFLKALLLDIGLVLKLFDEDLKLFDEVSNLFVEVLNLDVGCVVLNFWLLVKLGWLLLKFIWFFIGGCCCGWLFFIFLNCV